MALYVIAVFGSTPIGALLSAGLTGLFNPRAPFYVGGAAAILGGIWMALTIDRRVQEAPREPVTAPA